MSFAYDDETHTYRLHGSVLPSVTQIIEFAGRVQGKEYFTDFHRERGRAIHDAIRLDVFCDLAFDALHPEIRPYVEHWQEFKKASGFKPLPPFCETPTYHPVYLYAGTPDLLGIINDKVAVIDIKSGECPTAKYQLAAYAGFPEIEIYEPERFDLRLSPKGFRLKRHEDPNDWLVFLSDLNNFRREEYGR